MSEYVLTDIHEHVATLLINRPPVNAFHTETIAALRKALHKAGRDPQVRVIVLGGAGGVFSAGQDLAEFRQAQETPISYREHLAHTYSPLVLELRQIEKPVLAAIEGAAAGAALGVALACDLRIAADTARFWVGFLGIGLAPDSAVSLLLPHIIGLGRAAEFAFTNAPISAEQALSWGMVNRLAPAAELLPAAQTWAAELARGPVKAMGLTKRAFNRAVLPHLTAVLDYEGHLQEIAGRGAEHREGVTAFFEKRPPDFLRAAEEARET